LDCFVLRMDHHARSNRNTNPYVLELKTSLSALNLKKMDNWKNKKSSCGKSDRGLSFRHT